jgi:hypothetical protein
MSDSNEVPVPASKMMTLEVINRITEPKKNEDDMRFLFEIEGKPAIYYDVASDDSTKAIVHMDEDLFADYDHEMGEFLINRIDDLKAAVTKFDARWTAAHSSAVKQVPDASD